MDIKNLCNDIKGKATKHSPEILIGVGIAGMFSSVVMAVKATPKVYSAIEKEKEVRRLEEEPELTKVDILKMSWKSYLPATIMFGLSATCIIGANNVNTKRNAVLTTACHVSERALSEYRNKVVEVIGEEKEKEVSDTIFTKFWVNNYLRFDTCDKEEQKKSSKKCNFEKALEKDFWDFEHKSLDSIKDFLKLFQ